MDIFANLIQQDDKAATFGFKWEHAQQILAQIQSECQEIRDHLEPKSSPSSHNQLQEEIGDLIHASFSLCLFLKLNPQETLQKSIDKFERRFKMVEKLANQQGLKNLVGQSFEDLMLFWDNAKKLTDDQQ